MGLDRPRRLGAADLGGPSGREVACVGLYTLVRLLRGWGTVLYASETYAGRLAAGGLSEAWRGE